MSTGDQKVRVLIMAGGTGGHVFPALAVAEELRERNAVVEWLGTQAGIEARLVPASDIKLNSIDIVGLRGRGVLVWLKMPFLLMRAIWQAMRVVRNFAPQVVLGMGGFASGPGALAAKIMGKPIVIHEQNAIAGTTNRWLSKLTSHCLEAFPGSLRDAVCVGNPIRKTIVSASPGVKNISGAEAKKVLILGGSLGARRLNEILPGAIAKTHVAGGVVVRHQTGNQTVVNTKSAYEGLNVPASVEPFIDDMSDAYQWADLVVCRSGALTVSEISAVGIAAVFIPYPHAIDDHQTKNAQWLVQNDAAEIIQEADITVEKLAAVLNRLLNSNTRLNTMAANAKRVAKLEATQRVAEKCLEVAHG